MLEYGDAEITLRAHSLCQYGSKPGLLEKYHLPDMLQLPVSILAPNPRVGPRRSSDVGCRVVGTRAEERRVLFCLRIAVNPRTKLKAEISNIHHWTLLSCTPLFVPTLTTRGASWDHVRK